MSTILSISEIGLPPGLVERLSALMGDYYEARLALGRQFRQDLAQQLRVFLADADGYRDAMWLVMADGEVAGCAAVDGRRGTDKAALFRWFILDERLRGRGLGRKLLARAVDHARSRGFRCLELSTHQSLEAAVHLYRQAGFALSGTQPWSGWGPTLELLQMRLPLYAVTAHSRLMAA